jgi:hypothetical protein
VASLHSASLRRRLDALTEAVRRTVEYREELREKAKAWATIRSALADANIDPAQVSAVRAVNYAERELVRRGESPALQRADAAFVVQDKQLASRESFTDKWARRAPDFAGQPPPRPGASLADWYAWSLAARSGRASEP